MIGMFLSFLLYELPSADSADAHEVKVRYNLIMISTILYLCVQALSRLWWKYCSRTATTTVKAIAEEELATELSEALVKELEENPAKLLAIAEIAASKMLQLRQAQVKHTYTA